MNLQDMFLNQARIQRTPVLVYLVGGHQLRGSIRGFDNFVVVLDVGGKLNLVYKHSISTIMPLKPLPLFEGTEAARTEPAAADEANDEPVI